MAETQDKKQIEWLKYINTLLITMILFFSAMSWNNTNQLKREQAEQNTELMRLKTKQDINALNVSDINARVVRLETDKIDDLKLWVETYFERKK